MHKRDRSGRKYLQHTTDIWKSFKTQDKKKKKTSRKDINRWFTPKKEVKLSFIHMKKMLKLTVSKKSKIKQHWYNFSPIRLAHFKKKKGNTFCWENRKSHTLLEKMQTGICFLEGNHTYMNLLTQHMHKHIHHIITFDWNTLETEMPIYESTAE